MQRGKTNTSYKKQLIKTLKKNREKKLNSLTAIKRRKY